MKIKIEYAFHRILLSVLTVLTLLIAGCDDERYRYEDAEVADDADVSSAAGTAKNVYVVQDGDDIVSVALIHSIAPNQLMEANGLKEGDALRPGQKLTIPSGNEKPTSRADSALAKVASSTSDGLPSDKQAASAKQAAVPDEVAKLAAEKLAAEKKAAEAMSAEELAAAKREAAMLIAAKQAAEKKAAEELAAAKQEAEKLAAEKKVAEELASERLAAARREAETLIAEKQAAEKKAAEELAAAKREAEQLAAEKKAAEELASERLAAAKQAVEKLTEEKLAAEKLAAERLAAEKLASEKLAAAERLAAAKQAAPVELAAAKPADEKPVAEKLASETNAVPFATGLDPIGMSGFDVQFSAMPDLNRLMDFVKIAPSPGPVTTDWRGWCKEVAFRGAFAARTTYRVTVKAGLPMADGRKTIAEFRRTFTTGDKPPSVEFAARGRYLPAAGMRALAVKTVNVTNLVSTVRPVAAHNIVQLLAREEDCYKGYWRTNIDSESTAELAEDVAESKIRVPARLNEEVESIVRVRAVDGVAANGVYLVSVGREKDDEDEKKHRLVCVTDIGLSVRETPGNIYVWATSLTQGVPLKGVRVTVYGANNVPQGVGVTDVEGWCCCEVPESATPFAVVARRLDETDTSFLALRKPLDETLSTGARRGYVGANGAEAFVWTDRGIYRHDEPIFVHAILRNSTGFAPLPFPVEIALSDPDGRVFARRTRVSDTLGAVADETLKVPADQKSGRWTLAVKTPGDDGAWLGSRDIRIEEFVPPQIRVKVTAAKDFSGTNLAFDVAAEHLFGGPAKSLPSEGAVMFSDEPFAPRGWYGFRFGDARRRLTPNFTVVGKVSLDESGKATFVAALPANARPRAAVKMTAQGSVFENGGRPVSARLVQETHVYPFYIGVELPETVRQQAASRACRLVLVNPDGTPHRGRRKLTARFERIDWVYNLKRNANGYFEWSSDKVCMPVCDDVDVQVSENGSATLNVPTGGTGDYTATVYDPATDVAFSAAYWVSGGGDDESVRTALENPSRVTLSLDKPKYYVGDVPRLTVKAPFAGVAWLQVLRDGAIYSQVFSLTNATGEVRLCPVERVWAPGVDVALTVVQAAAPGRKHAANRAYGIVPLRAARRENELTLKVEPTVLPASADDDGNSLRVQVTRTPKTCPWGESANLVLTVVDEGINILTDEPVPSPIDWFGETREANHPFHDLYNYLLPIVDGRLKRSGVKTGGGAEGDLFRRISPTPSRRFKPLSLWQKECKFDSNGKATATFDLGEFVGEVRVTAVAYDSVAAGSAAERAKVAPKVVMQPDAPRFAAPGDTFVATVTLSNNGEETGVVTCDVMAYGAASLAKPVHCAVKLEKGASETIPFAVKADSIGLGALVFVTEGMGEKHSDTIHLPIRPASAWRHTSETVCIRPNETRTFENPAKVMPEASRRAFIFSKSPLGELVAALEHLVGYPHGCLEQTVSRVFPLVAAGGVLNTLPVRETTAADDAKNAVDAGIGRVVSMMRANDFVAWSDCNTPPWDREVSLWAAHFLVEADKAGFQVPADALARVKGFLRNWAMDERQDVSVYACHTLALAGTPDADRMLHWYDAREKLSVVSRCRLARAYVRTGDRDRARELTKVLAPDGVDAAAWSILALLDLDPQDARLSSIVKRICDLRDKSSGHWGTTAGNAHALLALGAYYRGRADEEGEPALELRRDGLAPEEITAKKAKRLTGGGVATVANVGTGAAYLTASCLSLSNPDAPAEAHGIGVARRFLLADGSEANMGSLARGDLLIAELTLKPEGGREYSDLVVEDLLPACFEPDTAPVTKEAYAWMDSQTDVLPWELRRDVRDDRVLIFSKKFKALPGKAVRAHYAVRVVSAGEFILPGTSVEAMYAPEVRAWESATRIRVAK